MPAKSFKTDESFLQKIAIGAIGTKQVLNDLRQQGHNPIELERGSTGFKIWKFIKIKRVRVPDILCINSGIRIESRAKTKLVISMSHSLSDPTRGWDYGLKDNDYVALVTCGQIGESPIDWQADSLVQYITVSDLRSTFNSGQVIQEKPKGSEEGFESRVTWPAAVASDEGTISFLSEEKLQYKRQRDNRIITLKLSKNGTKLISLFQVGQSFPKNSILASVVNVFTKIAQFELPSRDYYWDLLKSSSIADRYTAAKALSFTDGLNSRKDLLLKILRDNNEHIYVRLEIAAALSRRNHSEGFDFIEKVLASDYLENRLEGVIILGEIDSQQSCDLLLQVLSDQNQHPEIRGGAAWSLGELKNRKAIPSLIRSFQEIDMAVKMEAARALRKLCSDQSGDILECLVNSSETERPGISWALSKSGNWELNDILRFLDRDNLDLRHWATYILGNNQSKVVSQIETLRNYDPEIYFAVTVLWKLINSWVYDLKEY